MCYRNGRAKTVYGKILIAAKPILYYIRKMVLIIMDINQSIANFISAYKRRKNYTIVELSEDLEISRSVLQDYIACRRNPRADTIEHIAKKLNIPTAALVSGGLISQTEYDLIFILLDTLDAFHDLSPDRQREGIDLFIRLLRLLTNTEDT